MATPTPDPLALSLIKVLDANRELDRVGRLTPLDIELARHLTRLYVARRRRVPRQRIRRGRVYVYRGQLLQALDRGGSHA